MNLEELLNSKTPPKKDDLTDEDLARFFIKYKGLLKKLERDEAFWAATNENIKRAYTKLDELVEERTIKLKAVNEQLQQELNIRKKAEQKLIISEKRFREAYNRAEFYKDLFAHDINNILQSILSANEIIVSLGNYETNQKMVRLIEIIKEQVNRGKKLVSNVRKLSQIEGQEMIIEKIEIFNILKKAVKFIHNSFHDKNLKIQINTFSEQIYIKANELIEDVFENILINAVKYNNNPTIEINIKISKLAKEGNNYYKIEFIDNGVGIEDDRKTTIFQRADKSIGGMGLGLSLVKKIIQKYEGKVWVENIVKDDYSKGSNFIILIPEVIKDD